MRRYQKTFWLIFPFLLCRCGQVPILTSEAQEAELGDQAYQQVLAEEQVSNDSRLNALVQRVGERIAATTGKSDYKWEFKLLQSDQKNAFCLPGGKVAVYTGILPIAQTEAGLAVILGHEVAHATLRHAGQRITLMLGTQLGYEALQYMLSDESSTKRNILLGALGIGTQVGVQLPFSREMEAQADETGLTYTAKAGYDPNEAPRLWQRMAQSGGSQPPAFLSDHPSNSSREEALREEVPKVQPDYDQSPKYGEGETI